MTRINADFFLPRITPISLIRVVREIRGENFAAWRLCEIISVCFCDFCEIFFVKNSMNFALLCEFL